MRRSEIQFLGLKSGRTKIGAIMHRAEIGAAFDQAAAAALLAGPFPHFADHVVQTKTVAIKAGDRGKASIAVRASIADRKHALPAVGGWILVTIIGPTLRIAGSSLIAALCRFSRGPGGGIRGGTRFYRPLPAPHA